MENSKLKPNKNLLVICASAIFFFLSVTMLSEFVSRFVRDILLNWNVEFWIIFLVSIFLHFLIIIFGILFLKDLLLNDKFSSGKLFKFSLFAVVFCQLLYVANPFLYHLLDIEHMNIQWINYSKFTSQYMILSILNFSTTIFSYIFLGFVFYRGKVI